MSWKRDGDNVVLTLTQEEYNSLLIALGTATGQASNWPDRVVFHDWIRLANSISDGNPDWKPYEVKRP